MYNHDALLEFVEDFQIQLPETNNLLSVIKAIGDYAYKKDKEYNFLVCLDENYCPLCINILGIGSTTGVLTGPQEAFRVLSLSNACGFLLLHNHPCGEISSLKPSTQDIDITTKYIQLSKITGILLIDHIIITRDGENSVFLSLRETKKHNKLPSKISLKNIGEFRLNMDDFPSLPDSLIGWEDNPMFLSHYTEEELATIYPNKDFDFER